MFFYDLKYELKDTMKAINCALVCIYILLINK